MPQGIIQIIFLAIFVIIILAMSIISLLSIFILIKYGRTRSLTMLVSLIFAVVIGFITLTTLATITQI